MPAPEPKSQSRLASHLVPTGSPFEFDNEGQAITGRTWGSPAECRAAALLVHGLGAHSGWFEALARKLKVRRIYTLAYDQLGFGKRRTQQFTSYQQWLDDLKSVYHYLESQVGDKPIYVMGNSMGALIALAAAEAISPSGLILFSPGFDGYPGTFTLNYRVRALLQATIRPEVEIELPYSTELVSRDESVRQWIDSDPERRFAVPGRMLLELLRLTMRISRQYKNVTAPVLMITAGIDKIVNNKVNDAVYEKLGCPQKQRIHLSEAWHDLMFDPALDEVTEQVLRFISESSPEKLLTG